MRFASLVAAAVCLGLVEARLPEWAYINWKNDSDGEDEDELMPTSPAKVTFSKVLRTEECMGGGTVSFMRQAGVKYKCCMAERSQEPAADHSTALALLAAPSIPEVNTFLTKHKIHGLTWETSQWWSYEICFGQYIRQYHADDGVIKSEFLLGLGAHPQTETTCPTHLRYENVKERVGHKVGRLSKANTLNALPPVTGVWTIAGNKHPYFVTEYSNGEICDLTKKPRMVEVRLHCRQGTDPPFNISEGDDCRYIANVNIESVCDMPAYIAVDEYLNRDEEGLSPKQKIERAVKRRDAVLASKNVASVYDAILRELGSVACVSTVDGWWTYELCLRHWLRQFHEEDDVIHAEYFIGRGVHVNKITDPIMSKTRTYLTGKHKQKHTMRSRAAVEQKVMANGTWTAHKEGGAYYFKTLMTNGQVCDLTNQPRETEVKLYCGAERSLSVLEVATCKYEARLHLNSLCSLDAYRYLVDGDSAHKEAPPARLVCAPEKGSDTTESQEKPAKLPIIVAP